MSSSPPILSLSIVPQVVRQTAHFVKIANEYAGRDIVIYYWCLFKAVDDAMKIDSNSPDSKQFLMTLVDILEQVKKVNKENEAIMQNVVAQSHIEDQALKLFQYAESQDKQGQFNQKMVKAFYTCGYLFDVLTMFGNLDENIQSARKYAKWRATYIFGCLKRGEQPTPGNETGKQEDGGHVGDIASEINDELSAELNALNASINGPSNKSQSAHPYSANEFGQPQVHAYQPPPHQPGIGPSTYGGGGGAYPNIGQQHPNAFGVGQPPRPGLQHQEHPFRPVPSPHQQPAAKPRGSPQPHPAVDPATKPMTAAQMSPQPAQNLKLEDYLEAKKYTKFASSALDYEDPKTAIDYLQKAIAVLQKQPFP